MSPRSRPVLLCCMQSVSHSVTAQSTVIHQNIAHLVIQNQSQAMFIRLNGSNFGSTLSQLNRSSHLTKRQTWLNTLVRLLCPAPPHRLKLHKTPIHNGRIISTMSTLLPFVIIPAPIKSHRNTIARPRFQLKTIKPPLGQIESQPPQQPPQDRN